MPVIFLHLFPGLKFACAFLVEVVALILSMPQPQLVISGTAFLFGEGFITFLSTVEI